MSKPSQFSLTEGEWIGGTPYRVVRPLGLGGMGEVYEVDHTRTGTRRAIKLLREAPQAAMNAANRLTREGRALAAMDHPNVVRVYEVGTIADGRPYFSMQLLEGRTFRALLERERRLSPLRAVRLVLQALAGLEAVHGHSVIHRDLKPTNLFLCNDGLVKVLDFGVAKLLDGGTLSPSTAAGMVLGTMRYMAPEQLSGQPVSAATDVYAMALVLFELITGHHPFQGRKAVDASMLARLRGQPARLSRHLGAATPSALEAVLERALDREPERRYQTARGFADALRAAVQGAASPEKVPRPLALQRPSVVQWNEQTTESDLTEPTTIWQPEMIRCERDRSNVLVGLGIAASVCSLVIAGIVASVAVTEVLASHTRTSGAQFQGAPTRAGALEVR